MAELQRAKHWPVIPCFCFHAVSWYVYFQGRVSFEIFLLAISVFSGTIARVFTSIQDTGDNLLIASFAIAAVLNAVLFVQFFLYWNEAKRKKMR